MATPDDSKANDDLRAIIALWLLNDSLSSTGDDDDWEPSSEPESLLEPERNDRLHSFDSSNPSDGLDIYNEWNRERNADDDPGEVDYESGIDR